MKIAVALTANDPDGVVNTRFGRSEWFLITDTDEDEANVVSSDSPSLSGGAGVATAQWLADAGVEAVLAGNYGPSAVAVLQAAGIKMYVAGAMNASAAMEQLKAGHLAEVSQATTPPHSGLRR